ncbi:MAG TPA: ribonuclease H-like domain-containing protein [Bacillota bacterium]|nr:ribonuclease H-like domain-containing protein [Bacillota bacterium]
MMESGLKLRESCVKHSQEEFYAIGVREIANDGGIFELLEFGTQNLQLFLPDQESLKKDLTLIYGIGEVTAGKLRQNGVNSITDLVADPRWGRAALELVRAIERRDIVRLGRYGASDLQLLSFFQPEAIKFIDIETTGLYYLHPVFLVGILQFTAGEGRISQFLARSFDEEKAVLQATLSELMGTEVITSFNGRSFDLPYLKGRMRFHGLNQETPLLHLDLLRPARQNYRGILPNCRLLTIEQEVLKQEREGDIPGAQVADYYYRYLDTQDRSYLDPILRHNASDLLSMAKFLGVLTARKEKTILP